VTARRARIHTRVTRQGVELRVDGTLASLVRPGQASTGPVWDAIAAPLLALPRRRLRRLLVLGFGGGSVARIARSLAPDVHIVGVELDREVIRVGERELGLKELRAEIVIDDALAFVRRERRTFDAIIDDVFEGGPKTLRKPAALIEDYALVRRRLAPGGVLIANTIDETSRVARALAEGPGTLVKIALREWWNYILAVGPETLRPPVLRSRLAAEPMFAASREQLSVRTLRP
jgi:spermidine synthase